jgi:hypothetical protein
MRFPVCFTHMPSNCIMLLAIGVICLTATSRADNLIDVAFTGASVTKKTGFAATGLTADDFWNTCTLQWEYIGLFRVSFGALSDLKFTDASTSATDLSAGYFYNVFPNGASDPMYGTYFDSENATMTITGLSPGAYDFYLYGHGMYDNENTVFKLSVGMQSYGSKATINGSGFLSPYWEEGVQYVEFNNVGVSVGQTITIMVDLGASQDAALSGIQVTGITQEHEIEAKGLVFLGNLGVG